MSPRRPVSDDELGDYLDGRLDPAREREVEAWLREHPEAAAKVQRMRRIDDDLRALGAAGLDEPVPERLRRVLENAAAAEPPAGTAAREQSPPGPAGRARRTRRFGPALSAIAAALLIFVLGAFTGWSGREILLPATTDLDQLLDSAVHVYAFYAAERDYAIEFPPDQAEDFERVSTRLFEAAIGPPDLSEAGYTYRGARITPTWRQPGTLFLFEAEGGGDIGVLLWRSRLPSIELASRVIDDLDCWYRFDEEYGFAVLGPKGGGQLDDVAEELVGYFDDAFTSG